MHQPDPHLDPDRAADIADRVLALFREVESTVDQKPFEGQFLRIRQLLLAAQQDLDTVTSIPASRSTERQTSISRDGILMMVRGEIALLARLKVALGLHATRGDTLTIDPYRVFVASAVATRSLLATPTLSAALEVGGGELHSADPFQGA